MLNNGLKKTNIAKLMGQEANNLLIYYKILNQSFKSFQVKYFCKG